ncbi:MAG: adenylate/guanylate cyclase domain-containing protein [Acidobacteriota bacterium]|nr:FHA domain-containing protein [Blastocatellia bacterium]MDW8412744.1 adenylate/guanylate cyclase domain-containing protein [Acidobacteriota bacterium]
MSRLKISSTLNNEIFEYEIKSAETRIGRSNYGKSGIRNDLVLSDNQVSREHCVITKRSTNYYVRDLGSANGTFVNGERISAERLLSEDDIIQVGHYFISLKLEEVPPPPPPPKMSNTVLLRSSNPSVLVAREELAKLLLEKSQAIPEETRKELEQLRRKAEILSYLYELSSLFNSIFSFEEIFDRMAEMLFRITPAERCLVQLKDPETGELKTKFIKFRSEQHNKDELISPPRAIVDQVIREQVSLLSLDAQMDERILGKSVILQNVQSVICCPLTANNKPLGVLYIDTHKSNMVFSPEDLDLMNAIATQTSMALDNAATHERLMKEALAREAYSRFLPDHIVNEILSSPDSLKLGGVNKEATILFADVRGFTPLSERLRPEQVVELLNEYFTNMTEIIFANNGLLDKYIGDGMMVLFGVAYAAEDAPSNAVRAAIQMQQRMCILREKFKRLYNAETNIGIGINTGTITVGYIGSNRRMEYTGIGDAVNLAARLESNTKPSQILISSYTNSLLAGKYPTRPLGSISVKGKSQPQEVYEVLWQEVPL